MSKRSQISSSYHRLPGILFPAYRPIKAKDLISIIRIIYELVSYVFENANIVSASIYKPGVKQGVQVINTSCLQVHEKLPNYALVMKMNKMSFLGVCLCRVNLTFLRRISPSVSILMSLTMMN